MDVVYDVLKTCDVALGYVTKVNGALNTIQQAYQIFLNSEPANQASFANTVTIGGVQCAYSILLDGEYYTLTVDVSGVEVHMYGDIVNARYGSRVQIDDKNVLKYEIAENKLIVALNVLNSYTTYIEFMKEGDSTIGYVYQYIGALGVSTAKSALLRVDTNYTTVVGTMGDFIPSADGRNCEVYDNATGRLVGTEVSEILLDGKQPFDTLWYNLWDISGITSIKKVDDGNGTNPDTIYINGKSDTIHTQLAGASAGLAALSRRFDIEFKEVCAYTYDASTGKYTQKTFEVPMLFVQEKYATTFEESFADKNDVTIDLLKSSADLTAVANGYHTMVSAYNQIVDLVTQQVVIDFCAKRSL